jgi:hypothetical protein
MKVINFFMLLIGSVLIFMGVLEMEFNRKKRCEKIEYRVIPRNIYDDISTTDMDDQFSFMFNSNDARNRTNLVC